MHPKMLARLQGIAVRRQVKGPFLEIGASAGKKAVLANGYFADKPDRHAINLKATPQVEGITFSIANSNDMTGVFKDGQFGCVISNATLEHDRYFWKSAAEMKRVLAPGGFLLVAAPGYIEASKTKAVISGILGAKAATVTLNVHVKPDYWRFSRQAFEDVICEGLEIISLVSMLSVPRILAVARKPMAAVG